ncbi:MAG: hypothetical protein NTV22_11135 [bacterium]|nr:hypothetical protein [bacterium]
MNDERHIEDYAAWRAALLPRVHAAGILVQTGSRTWVLNLPGGSAPPTHGERQ